MYPLTGFFVASRSERQFHRTVYSNYPLRDSARANDYPPPLDRSEPAHGSSRATHMCRVARLLKISWPGSG